MGWEKNTVKKWVFKDKICGGNLGRIKTTLIKRISTYLMEKYPDKFTEDFGENKKIVNEVLVVESKKIKDQVAGYITRLKKLGWYYSLNKRLILVCFIA